MISRRTVLITGSVAAVSACSRRVTDNQNHAEWFQSQEAALGGGRIGVHALSLSSGDTISHRADERFAMCSTFKWALAAFVMKAYQDADRSVSETTLSFSDEDLLSWSPRTEAALAAGRSEMTVMELMKAIVEISDNLGANLLLAEIGGPEGFTRFCRELGDKVTRLDRWELALNENLPGDLRDTTSPRAMAQLVKRILFEDQLGLGAEGQAALRQMMIEASTGMKRLRGGFPGDWLAGDKTGTSGNGAFNDVAFGAPQSTDIADAIIISSYINAPDAEQGVPDKVHRDVAARFAATIAV